MTSTPVEPASQADGASSSDPAPTGGRPGHALEWQAPTLIRIDEHTTIPSMLQDRVRRSAARPLIARKQEIGETWRNMTAQEFYDDVLKALTTAARSDASVERVTARWMNGSCRSPSRRLSPSM